MTLQEKFTALTPEQRKQFGGVKTTEAFDAFLNEHKLEISEEERQQVHEYIDNGVLPLIDEELDNVAGGRFPIDDGRGSGTDPLLNPGNSHNAPASGC